MRMTIGRTALLVVAAAGGLAAASFTAETRAGLSRLMSATIAPPQLQGTTDLGMADVVWHAPGETAETPVALSEQDWLKQFEDVAPVSYLGPQAPASSAPYAVDQQPL